MRFMTFYSIFRDISENRIVFSSFPYSSLCVIDVILIAAGRMGDSSIAWGVIVLSFFLRKETSKETLNAF